MHSSRVPRRMTVLPGDSGMVFDGVWFSGRGRSPAFIAASDGHTGAGGAQALREELGNELAIEGHPCFVLNWEIDATRNASAIEGDSAAAFRAENWPDDVLYVREAMRAYLAAQADARYVLIGHGFGAALAAAALEKSSLPEGVVWVEPPLEALPEMIQRGRLLGLHTTWCFAAERENMSEVGWIQGMLPASSVVFVTDAAPDFQRGLRAFGRTVVQSIRKTASGSERE